MRDDVAILLELWLPVVLGTVIVVAMVADIPLITMTTAPPASGIKGALLKAAVIGFLAYAFYEMWVR